MYYFFQVSLHCTDKLSFHSVLSFAESDLATHPLVSAHGSGASESENELEMESANDSDASSTKKPSEMKNCQWCGGAFKINQIDDHVLKYHKKELTEDFPCQEENCGRTFTTLRGLQSHAFQKHKRDTRSRDTKKEEAKPPESKKVSKKKIPSERSSVTSDSPSVSSDTDGDKAKTKKTCSPDSTSETRVFICETCSEKVTGHTAFKLHLKKHSTSKNYFCVECQKGLASKYDTGRHWKNSCIKNTNREIHCTKCVPDLYIVGVEKYINHLKRMHNISFKCKTCHERFLTEAARKSHVATCSKE